MVLQPGCKVDGVAGGDVFLFFGKNMEYRD